MSRRALVVEDDPDQLHIIASVLAHHDIEVVTASSGSGMLERLDEFGPFDVIITDISMPAMTGVEAVQLARAAGHGAPVIVTTAMRGTDFEAAVAALGRSTVVLQKPFTLAALRRLVEARLA